MFNVMDALIALPGILIGLSFHEFAHAYVAYLMGDDTARRAGRLSLNPFRHIEPVGFLMLMIAKIGWARPVPVREDNFENKKLGIFLVSIAGIVMNLILAFVFTMILKYTAESLGDSPLFEVLVMAIIINVSLATFNLLPIPPLDGYRVVSAVMPAHYRYKLYPFERYSMVVLFLLASSGALDRILDPMFNSVLGVLMNFFYV